MQRCKSVVMKDRRQSACGGEGGVGAKEETEKKMIRVPRAGLSIDGEC